jgi:hypothetical protein
MMPKTCFGLLIAFILGNFTGAQQPASQSTAPPLMTCGAHGDIEILCGTRSPEDLELTPDGKYLVAYAIPEP